MEYLYINMFILFLSLTYIRGENNTLHDCMEPFIRLMRLTEESCDGIDWCFIKTADTATDAGIRGCCKRCSCSNQCPASHSCCPDFGLKDRLNGQIYSNVSEFVSVLRNNVSCTDEDNVFSDRNTKRLSEGHENLTCSYSRLKPLHHWRVKSSMYAMVTSCTNGNVGAELKSKCESTYSSLANMNPTDVLPVQSLITGFLYRNKFCFICSNETFGQFIQWNMVVASTSVPIDILYSVISSFHDIIHYITSVSSADLFYEPTNELKRLRPPETCVRVDVSTCPSENGVYDSYEDTYTKEACQTYTLPVYSRTAGKVKAYNNIACVKCNNVLEQCSYFYRWEQHATSFAPFLGTLALSKDIYQTGSTDHNTFESKLGKSFSTNCGHGYAYDKELDVCRKVYCPCGMMIYNSTCVFIFGEMTSQFTTVAVIEAKVQHQHDIDQYLFEYLYNSINASAVFLPVRIELLKSKTHDGDYAVVVTVSRSYSSVTLSDVVSEALKLFKGDLTLRAGTRRETQATIRITDSLTHLGRHTLVDLTVGKTYELIRVDEYANTSQSSTINSNVQISECNFCYRVELPESEFQRLSTRDLLIKRTQIVLPRPFVQNMYFNASRRVVCISQVFGTGTNQKSVANSVVPKPGDVLVKPAPNEDDADGDSIEYLLAMSATIVATFLVVCLLRIICKRLITSPVTHQAEIELSTISRS